MGAWPGNPTIAERLLSKVIEGEGGCLLWQGYIGRNGYGQIGINYAKRTVHRVAYEQFVGPIPDGLEIDHLCRVRRCINPAHLEPVTHRENMLRSEGVVAQCARKTHCSRGHEYTPENTYRWVNGHRQCRACWRIRDRQRDPQKRAAARQRAKAAHALGGSA